MFNPKAFLLFLTVVVLLALAVEARQGALNVWLAIAAAIAGVVITSCSRSPPWVSRQR